MSRNTENQNSGFDLTEAFNPQTKSLFFNNVYAPLIINSEYTERAGMKQSGDILEDGYHG